MLRTLRSVSRYRAPNANNGLHNRASLLGPHEYHTPPSSGRSSPLGGGGGAGGSGSHAGNPYSQRFADDLEGQNDEALEGLTAKVKLLKDVRESLVWCNVHCGGSTDACVLFFRVRRSRLGLGTKCGIRLSNFLRWCVTLNPLSPYFTVLSVTCFGVTERRVRGNLRHPQGHLPANEQHGIATGLPMAVVYRVPRPCLLVLHCRLVVSTVTQTSLQHPAFFSLVDLHCWTITLVSSCALFCVISRCLHPLITIWPRIQSVCTHIAHSRFRGSLRKEQAVNSISEPSEKKRKEKKAERRKLTKNTSTVRGITSKTSRMRDCMYE